MTRSFGTNLLLLAGILLGGASGALAQPQLSLPAGPLNQASTPSVVVTNVDTVAAEYFTVQFTGVPAGLAITNQSYLGWCPDYFGDFSHNNAQTPYTLYSSYDNTHLPVNAQSPNWDKVNWLLNNKPDSSIPQNTWIVQQVMWRLLSNQYAPSAAGYPLPQPATDNLYNQAMTLGAGFVPAVGQTVGVLMYVDGIYPNTASNGLPANGQPNVFQEVLIEVPVTNSGAIGDFVWKDLNHNGVQDAGEPGINGVTVTLCQDFACSQVLATTTTATYQGLDGHYQFTGLPAGTYWVSVNTQQPMLTGLVPTTTGQGTPATDSNVNPAQVILATDSSQDQTIDFGFTPPGTSAIGDFIWNDSNGNGLQDAGEPGIPAVKVNLCSDGACNQIIATTTTDQNGAYHFTGLFGGSYWVQVDSSTLPPGFTPTLTEVGYPTNAAIDSNGNLAKVVLPDNFTDNTIDFGFVPPAQGAIGDFVWHDLNRNGIQDLDAQGNPEPGINNVTVQLFDSQNKLVGVTTTTTQNGRDGYYQFTGLAAGTYTVVIVPATVPPGYTPTATNAPGSTPATDSNGSGMTVTLATNSSVDETIDFGYISPCQGAIGDFVWNDINANGIQDAGELGIPNVTVNLRAPDNTLILSTQTDANGHYLFNGRCAGNYIVEVVQPTDFVPSPSNAPGSTTSNDSNGSPALILLGIDATDTTVDFGYYQLESIAGIAYSDVNGNQVYDAGTDTPLSGVTINLTGTDVNGKRVSQTTTTTGNGSYLFSGLLPGTYQVTAPGTAQGETLETPAQISISLAPGQNSTNNNFGYIFPVTSTCISISAVQGSAITPVTLTATGGAGGYTFTATGLPNGLMLSSAGVLSGTPTVNGTFPYTVTITDKNGNQGTLNCSLTVNPPVTSTCVSISAVQGSPITSVTLTATGGAGGYTFAATGLPAGLTLSSAGVLSGTPTVTGTFPYTVTITDKNGNQGTLNCSLTVNPPVTSTCVSISAVQGSTITPVMLTATGGGGGYTFTATGLPNGLTLSSAGVLVGTPTVSGTFPYTVTITDKNGNQGTLNCSLTVNRPVTSTCISISAVQGSPITSVTLTATGGVGGYTFSATDLPAGLTLSSAGVLSGTPTVSGTFPYTVTITDKNGNQGTLNCSLTVNRPVTSTCISISAVQGSPITPVTLTATGGVGGYTFSATGLPAGLTLSSAGVLSGTPTVTGTFPYTVTITDKNGNKGILNCSLTAAPGIALGTLTIGDTATIGFWHNKNGQALILSLNGGPGSKNLANLLASRYPYLWGAHSPYNLTNKTNADVAALFLTLFNVSGQKTDAQILAGALAVYVTNSSLAGTTATQYGFNSSPSGTGNKTFNVGSYGSALGLTNNATYTVNQLLQQANFAKGNGTFNADAFNAVFNGINITGDIV